MYWLIGIMTLGIAGLVVTGVYLELHPAHQNTAHRWSHAAIGTNLVLFVAASDDLDWARQQFVNKLGIDPFPGTINLIIDDSESRKVWNRLKATPGVRIDNPNDGPHDCDARCYPVSIEGQFTGAIVLPEVEGYPPAQIEIIAAIQVRESLDIEDGDLLTLQIIQ